MNKNGCYNREEFVDSYSATDQCVLLDQWRERLVTVPKIVYIPVRGTRDCQYTKENGDDPRCAGCRHQQQLSMPF